MQKYNRLKNRRHVEDNFDLDEYKSNSKGKLYEVKYSKNKKIINLISVLIGFFTLVLAVLFFQLINYYLNLHTNSKVANKANEVLYASDTNTSIPLFNTDNFDIVEPVVVDSIVQAEPPKTKEIQEDIQKLREAFNNDDIVGHITIAGTKINYTVAQSVDNDFYLKRDLYKVYNEAGSIFLDSDNDIETLSQNTVLYGHNMRDGSMFHNIRFYKDSDYFNSYKYIDFNTLYENKRWEIFAFYETNTDFNYIETHFNTDENFRNFIDEIRAKSYFISGLDVTTDDKILTLSTCNNVEDNERFVVHAKLVN